MTAREFERDGHADHSGRDIPQDARPTSGLIDTALETSRGTDHVADSTGADLARIDSEPHRAKAIQQIKFMGIDGTLHTQDWLPSGTAAGEPIPWTNAHEAQIVQHLRLGHLGSCGHQALAKSMGWQSPHELHCPVCQLTRTHAASTPRQPTVHRAQTPGVKVGADVIAIREGHSVHGTP